MKVDKTIQKKRCYICKKKPTTGNSITYKGIGKKHGGIGLNITAISKRIFAPNLQRVRHVEADGQVVKAYVCTKCIKAGKVKKPFFSKNAK